MRRYACLFAVCSTIVVLAGGLENYTVVRPAALGAMDEFVLKDLNGLLERGLGAELPVSVQAPAGKKIFFGIPSPGFNVASLANQEHVTVVKDGDIYLFGGGTNGTRYAVYDFLQNVLGYRFFDARGGMAVPDLKKWTPTDGTRRRKFAFEERSISIWLFYTGPESALFLFRHGVNRRELDGIMKRVKTGSAVSDYYIPSPKDASLVRYLPRQNSNPRSATDKWIMERIAERFGGDLEKVHPEYFSMQGGKRVFGHQRCLSNPEVRALLKDIFFEHLDRIKEPAYVDLSAGDTPGRFCGCEGCLALEKKYGTNAGPLLDVFLEFCPEAARRFPRHNLMTLIYRKVQTQRPPTNLVERMPDNFVARFAPINDDFSKDWTSPANADTFADLKRWCQLCRKVLMWYYPNPYGGELTPPLGNIERLANDIRIMKELGVTGATFEHDIGVAPMTGFTELQSYVMLRLFDDTAFDWRRLVDEFIDYEYGAAADGVKKYLAELETLRKATKIFFPWNATGSIARYDYLTPERLLRWAGEFDRMEQMLAADRTRLHTLRRLRINLDLAMLCLVRQIAVALPDRAPRSSDLAARIRVEAAEIVADCYARQFADIGRKFVKSLEERLFLLEIQSGTNARPLPPEIFGGIPPEKLFITLPISDSGGMTDDPAAAYGKAVLFDGISKPRAMKLPFISNLETRMPQISYTQKIGRGVDAENIGPRGEYRFYEMGKVTITRDCTVELNTWSFRAYLTPAYVEGSFNKARVFASLKFQGPAFYASDTNAPNRVWCDRVVVVRE